MPTENFEGVTSAELLTEGPPTWVRRINAHYVRTGTVKAEDAALLLGVKASDAELTSQPAESLSNAATQGKK